MEIIKREEAVQGTDNEICSTMEYSFKDKAMDVGVATIKGRYPESGFCVNLKSKELVYVLEGSGEIIFEDKSIEFKSGDAILIDKNEKYYWNTKFCKVSMTCTPAWSPEQYKNIE